MEQSALKNIRSVGIRAINLDEGDELATVLQTSGGEQLAIATHEGKVAVFNEDELRCMGRTAVGVRGIKLGNGDYVVRAGSSGQGESVLTITENGYGKRTSLEEYRICRRGSQGVINYNLTEKTGKVADMVMADGSEDLLVITDEGTIIRVAVSRIKECGRNTLGVKVMNIAEGAKVICVEKTEHEELQKEVTEADDQGENKEYSIPDETDEG